MNLYNDLFAKKTKLSLVGLGYVGMPIAVAFAKKIKNKSIYAYRCQWSVVSH